jgi:lysyl-tRNA synthetase, class II
MSTTHLSEQEQLRREKLAELIMMGIEPYPAPLFPVNSNAVTIKENFTVETKEQYADICLAGRIMSVRDMGKANFCVLQDSTGRIQLYIRRDDICPGEDKSLYDIVWKKLIDIGDIIGIRGYGFITKTGETSVHVTELTILSKSLRPLPIVKKPKDKRSMRLLIQNLSTANAMLI